MSKNQFEDVTTGDELDELYLYLQQEKERNGWTPRITIAAEQLWQQFPYKENHMNKYPERTMMVLA